MIMKFRIKGFFRFILGIIPFSFFISCSNSSYRQNASIGHPNTVTSPAMVEKLWLARHHYDQDRRLIIPKVGGARWGAVQEYTADGNLVYRDWWVRNLKIEDLEASPPLEVEVLRDDDSNLRPPRTGNFRNRNGRFKFRSGNFVTGNYRIGTYCSCLSGKQSRSLCSDTLK